MIDRIETSDLLRDFSRKAAQFVIPAPTGRDKLQQESILIFKSQWIPGQARNDSAGML
jgi:hypothetical protein